MVEKDVAVAAPKLPNGVGPVDFAVADPKLPNDVPKGVDVVDLVVAVADPKLPNEGVESVFPEDKEVNGFAPEEDDTEWKPVNG